MTQSGDDKRDGTNRPRSGEAPFALEELFYSRTDLRGVIRSGNEVFERVAGYSWDQLVGAPHKIIRHPDMPRAVFWLLWQTIQQGRPIGAYVKNRAADGLFYWVFAVVTPIEGGYLSVRIKPSSELFPIVRDEYDALRAIEGDREVPAEDSAKLLLGRLKELGYPSYEAFMAEALSQEMAARDAKLGRPADPFPRAIWSIAESLSNANDEIKALVEIFSTIRMMPTNMRIAASRLEPAGGPISAISENYRVMAQEVVEQLDQFSRDGRPLADNWLDLVRDAAFLHSVARLQEETVMQTEAVAPGGAESDSFDEVSETGMLISQMLDYREKARAALAKVVEEVQRLPPLCANLRQRVVGLDAVRRSCRVENSWLGNRGGGLTSIIEQLDSFHVDTESRLGRITQYAIEVGTRLRLVERRRGPAQQVVTKQLARQAAIDMAEEEPARPRAEVRPASAVAGLR